MLAMLELSSTHLSGEEGWMEVRSELPTLPGNLLGRSTSWTQRKNSIAIAIIMIAD